MSIKQNGGVFGRNPTFNDVTIEGDLIINGEVFTGLDFQGSWNASTNTPALASSTGTNGEFYIVSVAGTTDLNGITNWGIGDWAIFNGTVWQRVEGGADGNFNDVTVAGSLSLGDNVKANFGASDDLQIYHDATNNYIDSNTGRLYVTAASSIRLTNSDNTENYARFNEDGSVQLYYDNAQKFATTATGIDVTGTATMDGLTVLGSNGVIINDTGVDADFRVESNGNANMLFVDGGNNAVGIGGATIHGGSTVLQVNGDMRVENSAVLAGRESASTPSHSFHDDSDTGMFNIHPNILGFSTAGGERFRIASDGSLSTPTAGTSNVRFGVNAGNSIVNSGNYNVVVGDEAGTAITNGDNNVAIGYAALKTEDTGANSVAIGFNALTLQNNDAQNYNVAVGSYAGAAVTIGTENTLIGGRAGDALTDADYNVALGSAALSSDTLGNRATALGTFALFSQNFQSATDNYNVAVGYAAGNVITTGTENTLIGGRAGDALTTGNYNVIVGSQSDSTAIDSEKAQGFGFNLACAAGYTTIGSGSDDIRAAHGNVTWATVSDERYKKDIVNSEAGLSFINALQPRTFKYKTLGELPETFSAYEEGSTEVFKNANTNHGFIAQEVKAAIDADSSIKDGFRLWDDRDDGSQEVAEAALIPVLTKAIQELSAQVDALTARIETLEG